MATDLLALVESLTHVRYASHCRGEPEYEGPCPWCGGRDRFRVWPAGDHPRFWCRVCRKHGDAIDLLRETEGLTFAEARKRAGELASLRIEPDVLPPDTWRGRARSFIETAQGQLWDAAGTEALSYLRNERGLTGETIRRFGLGYWPWERFEDPVFWGLGREVNDRGMRLPRGIVVPWQYGRVVTAIRVRLLAGERRYWSIRGSRPRLFGVTLIAGRRVTVMTEGEFDAMLLHQEAGDLIDVVATGSAAATPNRAELTPLEAAHTILAAYDRDAAGKEGAATLCERDRRVRGVHPVGGKDFTEMYRAGGDLRAWTLYHLHRLTEHEASVA